jgi:predicted metal-dependent hydrolase
MPDPVLLDPEQWRHMDEYLYAIDLYNYAYWWESHELLERLWLAAGRNTKQGSFFRALIQLAAANLKRFVGYGQAADNLTSRGITRLEQVPDSCMGIDVANLINYLKEHRREAAPLIRLA